MASFCIVYGCRGVDFSGSIKRLSPSLKPLKNTLSSAGLFGLAGGCYWQLHLAMRAWPFSVGLFCFGSVVGGCCRFVRESAFYLGPVLTDWFAFLSESAWQVWVASFGEAKPVRAFDWSVPIVGVSL